MQEIPDSESPEFELGLALLTFEGRMERAIEHLAAANKSMLEWLEKLNAMRWAFEPLDAEITKEFNEIVQETDGTHGELGQGS